MIRFRPSVPSRPSLPLAVALLVTLALGAICVAAPRSSGDPGRLPKTVVPVHYDIDLALDPESRRVDGFEVIDIEVREPTARVVLNADSIKVTRATIDKKPRSAIVTYDDDAETVTLTFQRPLPVGRHKLHLTFTGQIHKSGPGLYAVDYETEDGSKRLISSHLAPADARRMFPVWDEPALKATFALSVTLPRSYTAVSNMPIAREEPAGPGAKKISFQPTPKMSSYLVALTAGELERISAQVDGITVSVVTTAGKREQARFALNSAVEVLRYFNDYFGVKYPLPKLDLIAVPDGHVSAMEHWGAITFQDYRLLLNPATSSAYARREMFSLIAHEIAHQWFGNLVTMSWWDNLWLNEGFATWMESKVTERFHPRWRTWLSNSDEKQSAMRQDADGSAHPIHQPVRDKSAASEMFDDITYNKAGAVVRMLEGYLGPEVFRAGLRKYVSDYAYGNTTPADLWRALEAVSGKPVAAVATTFIEQRGVPLIITETKCLPDKQQRLVLRQEPFTINSSGQTARWMVPITVAPVSEQQRTAEVVLLRDETTEIPAGRCGDAVKLNSGDTGYYRVEYDAAMRAALIKSFPLLSPADRVNMLADAWALVQAGRAEPTFYLDLVEQIGDDSRPVWDQVMRVFKEIDRLQYGRPERAAFQAYARLKLRAVLDRVTWDAPRPDGDGTIALRAQLVQTLGEFGDGEVLTEARHRFEVFVQKPASLRPGLREAVNRLAGMAADRDSYDTLLSLARKATTTKERDRYYLAAAGARDPALAREMLNLTLSKELPSSLLGRVMTTMAFDGGHADLVWGFLRKNFNKLADRQGSSFREEFVPDFMKNFSDRSRAAELAAFAPAHATSDGRAAAKRAEEQIKLDADFKARTLPAIDEWIRSHSPRG